MISYDPKGLTTEQAAASRDAHGQNIITPPRDDSAWKLLAEKFCDPIIVILLIAAALSLVMSFIEGHYTETIGIVCAILLATCVGFLFEWDAMRRFRRLNQVNDDQPVKVRRNGVMTEIPRREVVVGDLVSLETGETNPADGELVEAVSLQVDESARFSRLADLERNANRDPKQGLAILRAGMTHFQRDVQYIVGFAEYLQKIGDAANAFALLQQSLERVDEAGKAVLWDKIILLQAQFALDGDINRVLDLEKQFRLQVPSNTNAGMLLDVGRYMLWGVMIWRELHGRENSCLWRIANC